MKHGQPNPGPVVLVTCCGQKLAHAAPARDLYTSDLFRKARAWAETFGSRWFILSAKHGLLAPDAVVEPYDVTLGGMDAYTRMMWGRRVAEQFRWTDTRGGVVVLAGAAYREWCAGSRFSFPLAGMGIGQQKAWLKAQVAAAGSAA